MIPFSAVLEALLIVTALSMDAFVSSFAYGADKIKIPPTSLLVINLICSGTLVLALVFGDAVSRFLPAPLTRAICILLLLSLGMAKVFDSALKTLIRKHSTFQKKFQFSLFHMGFILKIYANPEEADRDHSHILSPFEAAFLAIALSLDSLAVGFGAGLSHTGPMLVFLLSLAIGILAVLLGCALGNRLSRRLSLDLSWISGALLILLAILKLP